MNLLERLKSDLTYVSGFRRLVGYTSDLDPESTNLVGDDIDRLTDQHGDTPFILFEGRITSYADFERRANRFANCALAEGLKAGDSVALFMDNRPDYIAFWAGMAKIAVRTALINSSLQGPGLAHCINAASARTIVTIPELADTALSAARLIGGEVRVWATGGPREGVLDLDAATMKVTHLRPDRSHRAGLKASEPALFIYTSGTTGLPKAARITNLRAQGLMRTFIPAVGVTGQDRILLTLPLYHATGGMCGVGCALYTGGLVVLKPKFSASTFWHDAIDSRATMFVYVGELCRYLMNQPPSSAERSHQIVKAFGNGMRADVWRAFVDRTGIRRLVEFYGSTEGNVSFFNLDGRIGAVGRIPPLLRKKMPARIVRFDVETEQPVRGPDGLCIEAAPDEPGEAIGPISEDKRQRFDGYNDPEQTKKKVLRDVFAPGDMWFRTGDLMRKDKDGYLYFVDRIGDTFRWKSENVSTSEVELAIMKHPGVAHAVVYGVAVPGQEGRAGMAAIQWQGEADLPGLAVRLIQELPHFARPVFLRQLEAVDTTGTLKYRKMDLVKQGFDPVAVGGPVHVHTEAGDGYDVVTPDVLAEIASGRRRL